MGVEHLDLVGPHALLVEFDEDARQLLEVGLGPEGPCRRLGEVGTERDGATFEVLRPKELAAQAAANGGEEIEHRVGAVLSRPLLEHEPGRGEELPEELLPVLPVPALAPAQLPGHGDQSREQGLDEHPADERVGAGLTEHGPDQVGRLLACRPARGIPHVLDEVARGGTGRGIVRGPEDEPGQDRIARGDRAK